MATDLQKSSDQGLPSTFFWLALLFSILITIFDVFLLLGLMHLGFRKIEAIVSTLILTILAIFGYLVFLSKPDIGESLLIPASKKVLGIGLPKEMKPWPWHLESSGANLMPHNLYLHSSISQTRKVDYKDSADIKRAVRFMTWDSNIELSLAFVVNSLLLILGAASSLVTEIRSVLFF